MRQKVLICDYPNALECNYKPTMQSVTETYLSCQTGNSGLRENMPVEFEVYPYENDTALIKKLCGVTGLITGFLEIGEDILSQAENLSCISVSGAGYSNIDMQAAQKHGVTVCHIREYCTEEVAEHTFALIGALNRNLKYYSKKIEKDYEWKYHTISGGKNLTSQTLAVFGFGKIGRRVAQIAMAYGMKVLAVDPFTAQNPHLKEEAEKTGIEIVPAEEAFIRADIISNHMNLTDENYHFFNDVTFHKMQKSPIFINVARGGSVDEKALVRALDSKKIRAAGLDVLEAEKPGLKGNPLLLRENVILTPHSAFYSEESIEKLQTISGANMGYFLGGAPEKVSEIVKK